MNKIGILGGTFDPIHNGHIILAEECIKFFNLKYVYFVTSGYPYHKIYKPLIEKEERYNMVRIALKNKKKLIASNIDINRNKPTYTYEILNIFKKNYKYDDLYFIMGSDIFLSILNWKHIEEIVKKSYLIVSLRFGESKIQLDKFFNLLNIKIKRKILFLPPFNCNISSTNIRKFGLKKNMVPENLYFYIKKNNLYKII